MRISLVTETFWPEINGVAMTLRRLVIGLASQGHQLQLICPHRSGRDMAQLPANIDYCAVKGIPIPGYKEANFGLPCRKALAKFWGKQQPDVIYVATEGPLGWSAIKEANRHEIPVASGFHTNFHTYSKHYNIGFQENIVKRYLINLHNSTHTTLVPSEGQKQQLLNMGITNVSILGRGVDTQLFSPQKRSEALRQQWGVTENDSVMIYVGRIAAEKNLDLAIRTYIALHNINKRLKFVLVGDGPMAKSMKRNHPEFIFAGMQQGEELAAYFASGDLFIFPSLTETFGNVVLEAMASGLGVVAYDYAAAQMHIESGQRGLLASNNDAESFVNNAKRFLQNEMLLNQCRLNASKYAQSQSWESIVKSFENILGSLTLETCDQSYGKNSITSLQKIESESV